MLSRRTFFKGMMGCLGAGVVGPAIGYGGISLWDREQGREALTGVETVVQNAPNNVSSHASDILAIEAIEDLLDDVDCIELAARYVGPNHLQQMSEYSEDVKQGPCPWCRSEDFMVWTTGFKCQGCPACGNALRLFANLKDLTIGEAIHQLRALLAAGELTGRPQQVLLWEIMGEATAFFHDVLCNRPEGQPGREWLEQQHITQETRETWSLGYIPSDRIKFQAELYAHLASRGVQAPDIKDTRVRFYAEGITLPIQEANGKCWGYVIHCLNSEQEYDCLYRMSELSENRYQRRIFPFPTWPQDVFRYETVIAAEDSWDVITLRQAGIHNVVHLPGWDRPNLRTALALTSRLHIPLNQSDVSPSSFDDIFDCILEKMAGNHDRLAFLVLPDGQDPLDVLRTEGADGLRARMRNPLTMAQVLSL